ncbi:MAG: heme lyase CcmF/NrfE family subunit [Acidimicrobiaceae bacterium]|nr:heme lyase CcmF/NrfE family subunit [Acidimicrobiaceae bacterium]MYA74555.1 heme lyase CcmF/NrfE family subunit [Acidimicrobiaceae bacterium]MYC43163.1 heme lyase CcmF/NrfE family subunit [Acidimicrobiaceae bacterium]MYG54204.1 heme lyase CcmF/NrfE family subunit [Acidimicrobiaceae bacterium]MYJ97574.1 heme lyase CcmF/NrfE family subunit [Acidimicrobiaceae bacterium]
MLVGLMMAAAGGAFLVMERALITRDFTVSFVAQHGSSRTPAVFNVATLWSALEGSILLWTLVLCGYVVAVVVKFRERRDDPMMAWVMLTLFVVCGFFFLLMVGPARPFSSFDPLPFANGQPFDGPGPNPLLQNHILMAFHPPILYLGYVGFTVPFAFAVGALATGRVGEGWLLATRRWTVMAWGLLTLGVILGAWWSYETLGWGGYWGWDPVENVALLPWITGTAFVHSVMVQERRGMLRVWNLSLVIATFSLTILGTFITRSGALESVHAFVESAIGPWFLTFFGLVVVVSLGLIAWRGDELRAPGRIDSPLSREGAFLMNNVVFAAFAFVVLLGTIFPLIVEAFDGRTLTVGSPYFERMTMPIGFVLLFLMAIAPVLPWRKASAGLLSERLIWPAWLGVGAILLSVLVGARGWAPLMAFGLGGFAGGAALRQLVLATRRLRWRGLTGRTNGGMIVHLGVVLIAVALAASNSYVRQETFEMTPGETAELSGHTFTFLGTEVVEYSNRVERKAAVRIDGGQVYEPAIAVYDFAGRLIGIPSVRSTLTDDVALSIAEMSDDGQTVFLRVTIQPLIVWLWIGGFVMAAGTLLAIAGGSRRSPISPVSAPVTAAQESGKALA